MGLGRILLTTTSSKTRGLVPEEATRILSDWRRDAEHVFPVSVESLANGVEQNKHEFHPAHIFLERISHMEIGPKEVQHYLSPNRSAVLNQRVSASQADFGKTPALFSQSLLRRNSAGIGFKNKAVAKQKPALACDWSSTGNNAHCCQFFTWMPVTCSVEQRWTH